MPPDKENIIGSTCPHLNQFLPPMPGLRWGVLIWQKPPLSHRCWIAFCLIAARQRNHNWFNLPSLEPVLASYAGAALEYYCYTTKHVQGRGFILYTTKCKTKLAVLTCRHPGSDQGELPPTARPGIWPGRSQAPSGFLVSVGWQLP